jgi:mitochondrial intermembrane space import and assembly protein 40
LDSVKIIFIAARTSSSKPNTTDPKPTKEESFLSEPPTTESAPAEVIQKAEEAAEANEAADAEGHSEEQGGGGAYNPVTGEINWDCPCLGGMAHGPCGMQFREAFSCFIFSEQEPKGIDCVEKFKAMQDCFREHPDVYADGMGFFYSVIALLMCALSQK